MTILTLGMHAPNGYVSGSCPKKFNGYQEAMYCTSWLIRDFIEFLEENRIIDDSIVVVMGDHLTMRPISEGVKGWDKKRSIFNLFIIEDREILSATKINHFDIFPTVLELMGFKVEDGKAGLGCSALRASGCISLAEDDLISAKISKTSKFYNAMWLK